MLTPNSATLNLVVLREPDKMVAIGSPGALACIIQKMAVLQQRLANGRTGAVFRWSCGPSHSYHGWPTFTCLHAMAFAACAFGLVWPPDLAHAGEPLAAAGENEAPPTETALSARPVPPPAISEFHADSSASWTPLQISFWDPVQLFGNARDVYGIRLTTPYGRNRNVNGLDVGIYGEARGLRGIQIGFTNSVRTARGGAQSDHESAKEPLGPLTPLILLMDWYFGSEEGDEYGGAYGIQLGVLKNRGSIHGLQVGGIVNYSKDFYGLQVAGFGNSASGNGHGIQIGGFVNESRAFYGFQASLFGNETSGDTWGIQLAGLVNRSHSLHGFQTGLLGNNNLNDAYGIQVGFLFNANHNDLYGLQAAVLNANHNDLYGLQAAIVNLNWHDLCGLQVGALVNTVSRSLYGVQIGLVNVADQTRGLQIGVFNYTRRMSGLQIGLINIITEGAVPFLPIVNAGFR